MQALINEPRQAKDVSTQLTEIARRGTWLVFGAQRLALYEIIQAGQDFATHTRLSTNIIQEFLSKIAGAHSVKDIANLVRDCGHRQLDLIKDDYEHIFTHSHEIFEASSRLVLTAMRGERSPDQIA